MYLRRLFPMFKLRFEELSGFFLSSTNQCQDVFFLLCLLNKSFLVSKTLLTKGSLKRVLATLTTHYTICYKNCTREVIDVSVCITQTEYL